MALSSNCGSVAYERYPEDCPEGSSILRSTTLDKIKNLHINPRAGPVVGVLNLCWQPAKMGQSETREIKGLIEV